MNELSPYLTSVFLGRISVAIVALVMSVVAAIAAALVVGGLVAAWLDAWLVRDAAMDEELGDQRRTSPDRSGIAWRGLVVRFAAYVPLAITLAWGTPRIIGAVYAELTLPQDLVLPLALRVLTRAPETIALVGVAWVAGEVLGGLALRHLVLDGASIAGALRTAMADVIARPLASLGTTLVTDAALLVVLALGVLGSVVTVERVRMTIGVPGAEPELALALIVMAGVWFAALLAAGAMATFRSVAWTFELARRGTIGGLDQAGPGDWAASHGSGTL
jgi:hypothetical protein